MAGDKKDVSFEINTDSEKLLEQIVEKYDLPDGWTCIGCGDQYLEDTEGKHIANYDQGTLCKKCDDNDKLWHNDTINHLK